MMKTTPMLLLVIALAILVPPEPSQAKPKMRPTEGIPRSYVKTYAIGRF